MKIFKRVALVVVALVAVSTVALVALLLWLGAATNGPRVPAFASPRTALVIVDLQEDFTGPEARRPYRDSDRMIQAANGLIRQAGAQGAPVVFIANVVESPVLRTFMGGVNAPGAAGTKIDRRLLRPPGSREFTKGRGDAFSNPELDEYLHEQQVGRLVIVGLDAAHCVDSTARGALNRGYKVTLATDGIATEGSKSVEAIGEGWKAAGATVAPSVKW